MWCDNIVWQRGLMTWCDNMASLYYMTMWCDNIIWQCSLMTWSDNTMWLHCMIMCCDNIMTTLNDNMLWQHSPDTRCRKGWKTRSRKTLTSPGCDPARNLRIMFLRIWTCLWPAVSLPDFACILPYSSLTARHMGGHVVLVSYIAFIFEIFFFNCTTALYYCQPKSI